MSSCIVVIVAAITHLAIVVCEGNGCRWGGREKDGGGKGTDGQPGGGEVELSSHPCISPSIFSFILSIAIFSHSVSPAQSHGQPPRSTGFINLHRARPSPPGSSNRVSERGEPAKCPMKFLTTIIKSIWTQFALQPEAESQAPDSDGCVAPQEEAQPGTLHGAVAVDTCSSTLDGVSDVAPADSASSVAAKEETTSGTVEIYPASDDEAPPEGARTSATVEIAPADSAYDVPAKEETTSATVGGAPADSASNVAAVGDTTSGTVCGTAWAAAWSDPAGYGGWFIPHMTSHLYFRREKPSETFQHIGTLYLMRRSHPVARGVVPGKRVSRNENIF